MPNILKDLASQGVDQSELELLLQNHFGRASATGNQEVRLSRCNDPDALVLRYEDGELSEISPGPGLKQGDVSELQTKIQSVLLASKEKVTAQLTLFAGVPTDSFYRYRDRFQLVPIPDVAPRPNFALADHPLLLQYEIVGCPDAQIAMLRRERTGRELELLCTALAPDIKGGLGSTARFHWSITNAQAQDPSGLRSEYCQEAYIYPGENGIVQSFSSMESVRPMATVPAATYYNRYGVLVGSKLDLPDSFDACLDAYFGAPRERKDKFMRAAYWFQYARRVANLSRSGSFTALVCAVEALLPPAQPGPSCETCKRSVGDGPTKRFTTFVERYAPDPAASNTQRRQLYALRSALSHGGKLLHSDIYSWGGGMTPTAVRQWYDEKALWSTVRLVLVNWLLDDADDSQVA